MADRTKIEWTDATWNPVLGCAHISEGCDHCYAARQAAGRLRNVPVYSGLVDHRGRFNGVIRPVYDRFDQPLRWKRPRRIFVNSMSDMFHPDLGYDQVVDLFGVMAAAPRHQYQILTKRPQVMADIVGDMDGAETFRHAVRVAFESWLPDGPGAPLPSKVWPADVWPLPQVWLGTSIELNKYAFRANHLRRTPAAVRFLSLEPLLGPLPDLDLTGIDWVIVGGESGPGARPMHPQWVRDIRDRCVAAGIPFHFKQHGEYYPAAIRDDEDFAGGRVYDEPGGGRSAPVFRLRSPGPFRAGSYRLMRPGERRINGDTLLDVDTIALRVGKKAAGRELDGRTWDQFPEAP